MKRLNQHGSLHLGLLLAVVVVAAVAFAGYRVWSANQPVTGDPTGGGTAQATVPKVIHSKADLVQTGKVLDQDAGQIDASLNDSSLDNDINAML